MISPRPRISVASAARFLAFGGLNTLVTYLGYLVLLHWLPYRTSYSIAFASGVVLAYVMNRYLVFRLPGGRFGPLYVAVIYAGQYLLGLVIVTIWVDWIGGPARVAPLIAIVVSLPITYLCNAYVFRGALEANIAGDADMPSRAVRFLIRRAAVVVLIGLPALSLAMNALGWLRFGFDLPFYDDWRGYSTGQIDSLDPSYLFMGINDTMAPVGFALDAIAQRALDGNSVAYQLLSMTAVLGLLLLLQWKLLKVALGDTIQAAACFVFTLLMLQPGSYWGRENLAYHQALPLVFLLASLWLIVASPWNNRLRLPAIFGLGIVAGFTYISGAFGGLAAGVGVIAMAVLTLPASRRLRIVQGATALALAGLVTSVTQFKVGVMPTMGASHRGDARLALPYEPDFWLFYLGKIGRSLLLPEGHPVVSLALVLVACASVLAIGFVLLRRVRADPDGPDLGVAVVFSALAATVFVYLLLVAAGRTYLRGPEVKSALDVFLLGFSRFHFFWAALLWPWVIAAGIVLMRGRRASHAPAITVTAWLGCGTAVFLMVSAGAFDHFQRHRMEASSRTATVACLSTQLQKGEGIDCPEFNMADLTPAYIYATRIGASFVRYFSILPIEVGVNDPSPWFRLSRDNGRVETRNILAGSAGTMAQTDAQFHLRVGRPDEMENCVMLDVAVVVAAAQDDLVQLYFRPRGQSEFTETNSRRVPLKGQAGPQAFAFRVESETGFDDTLRLDPVNKPQGFAVSEVEVRCRLRYSTRPFFVLEQPQKKAQLFGSAWLDPVPGDPHAYRAGSDAQVSFKTDKPQQMKECSALRVEAKMAVQQKAQAQIYFAARGVKEFSEEASVRLDVAPLPDGRPQQLVFRLESAIGFEDKLRFDPVDRAQDVRISDVNVSCYRRLSSTWAKAIPAVRPAR